MWTMWQHSADKCPCGATAKGGLAAVLLAVVVGGCAQSPAARESAAVSAAEYQATFDAAVVTLREAGFTIDRQDYRFGTITTKPRPSPAAFEFWNGDNSTGEQSMAATVGAERRVVTVLLKPGGADGKAEAKEDSQTRPSPGPSLGGRGVAEGPSPGPSLGGRGVEAPSPGSSLNDYVLSVEVVIERMQDPDRRITGSTVGPRITRRLRETPTEVSERNIPGRYWVAMARDREMEGRLLEAVVKAR